ncbi:hypothetical protein P59_237 [Bacillus phage P59]|nr:hypothetical protein P59_008 [Bacillus phage P59]QIW88834.1 hypothetical protein P59_237 [Bacillus phage P59]
MFGMDWGPEIGGGSSADQWGWRVVRDYSFDPAHDEPEWNRSGKTYGDYQGGKHRYRLKDDDGNTMYIIESDIDPDEGYEEELFAPLDWAMNDVGATSIEYKDKNGEYQYL